MRNLLERLEKDVLVADGAMGTALYGNGLESCHEYNNISNPDSVEKIHRAYIEAGADIIQTNTYAAKKCQLKTYGYKDKFEEMLEFPNLVLSYHNFEETPENMMEILSELTSLAPKVVKVSVMAHNEQDVLDLMNYTRGFKILNPEQE